MNQLNPETIKLISESLGIKSRADAVRGLATEADIRLRETIQDAAKFMRHARRTHLTTADINSALKFRNADPIFGFSSREDPARFLKAAGHPDICYLDDPVLLLDTILDSKLPPPPVDIGVLPHWLAINGKQPAIPENIPVDRPRVKRQKPTPHPAIIMAPAALLQRDVSGGGGTSVPPTTVPVGLAATAATAGAGADQLGAGVLGGGGGMGLADTETLLVRAPVRHVITQELQAYYDTLTSLLAADNNGKEEEEAQVVVQAEGAMGRVKKRKLQRKALIQSLSLDAGLQPLSPHLVAFFAAEAANAAVRNPKHLCLILKAITAFVSNPFVELSHCLHDLLPTILTALLARRIAPPVAVPADVDHATKNHVDMQWEVRDEAAAAAAAVCKRYPGDYANTAARIQKTLLSAMTDVHRPIETVYGAVKGLCLQGPRIVKMLVMPQLQGLLERAAKEQQQQRDSGGGGVSLSAGAVAAEKMKERLKEAAEECVKWLQEEGVMKHKLVTAAYKDGGADGDGGDGEGDGPQEEEGGGGGGGRGKRGGGRAGRGRRGGRGGRGGRGRGGGRKRTSTDDSHIDEEMAGANDGGGGNEVKEIDLNSGENYLGNAWRDDFDVEVIIKVVETLFG